MRDAPFDDADARAAAAAAERARSRPSGALTVEDVSAGAGAIRCVLDTLGGPWQLMVLAALGDGPLRYGEIKAVVVGINDRMLSQTLQRFVRDGLATRDVVAERRSCVTYRLTDLGAEVRAGAAPFLTTVLSLAPRVAQARRDFDG